MDFQKNFHVCVAIIVDSENRVFIQKKDSGYLFGPNLWSLPGGHIEKGESAKEAMKRELNEELGINFQEDDIKFSKEWLFKGNLNGTYVEEDHQIFVIKFGHDLSEISVGEGIGFAFFEKEELNKLDFVRPTKEMLEEFFKQNDSSM